MLISDLKLKKEGGLATLSALVEFELAKVSARILRISVPVSYEGMLHAGYEAFLLGCYSAALYHNEERIHVQGAICPYLKNQLTSALILQKRWWFPKGFNLPEITAEQYIAPSLPTDRKAGCFFSGGVDSLASILVNNHNFETNHQYRYKYAFLAYGLDIGDPNRSEDDELFKRALENQGGVADEMGLTLIPIWTNMRDIEPNGWFYEYLQVGSLLSGLAHAVSNSVSRCSIAADHTPEYMIPTGNHIFLNSYLTSSYLQFYSEVSHLDRTDKVGLIAQNEIALSSIRVCYYTNNIKLGHINCGYCEKCLRTKLGLLAHGKLSECNAFPNLDIDKSYLLSVDITEEHGMEYYNDHLANLLEKQGETSYADIVRTINGHPALKYKIKRYTSQSYITTKLKERLKQLYRYLKRVSRTRRILKSFH